MKPRDQRQKVLIEARLRQDRGWTDARILNISRRGLMVRSPAAPLHGTYVEVCRGTHRIVARVVWVSQDRFGLRTQDAIAVDAVVRDEAALPEPANDPRSLRRRSTLEMRERRSRHWSRRFQFGVLGLFAIAAACLTFGAVREALSRPLNFAQAVL